MSNLNIFGYNWTVSMEGGRLIHPDFPYVYYDENYVKKISDNKIELSLGEASVKEIVHWDGEIYHPTLGGGLIRSVETFGYGTFSADIKLPKGKGLWPSFWLCGDGPWPESGEIDIEEGYSDNLYFNLFTSYFPWLNPSWDTTNNVHYAKDNKHMQIGSRKVSIFKQCKNPYLNYINYKCIWTPDEITIKCNNRIVRHDKKAVKEFSHENSKMNVILNTLCEDPSDHKVSIETPMIIENFKYDPLY